MIPSIDMRARGSTHLLILLKGKLALNVKWCYQLLVSNWVVNSFLSVVHNVINGNINPTMREAYCLAHGIKV